MAPTLVASRTALPPEGAVPTWGGPASELAPTLATACAALPLRPGKAGSAAPVDEEEALTHADPFALSLSKGASAPVASRTELLAAFDQLLQPERFKDYGPNGLQVEGKPEVRKIVSGVTASLALIEAAVAAQADAIFVHHGLFWRGQDGRVTGWMKQRLALLLAHDISLYAYHLPLDAHPELGNNAQLGRQLGLQAQRYFGENSLGFLGSRSGAADGTGFDSAESLAEHVRTALKRPVVLVGPAQSAVKNIAWCSGGAQGYFEDAIAAGADAFITGEISEPQAHYAREMGVAFIACGHHASERYGAPAVAAHVAAQFGLVHEFIDIDNPA